MKRTACRTLIYLLTLAISLLASGRSTYAQTHRYTGPFGTTVVNPFVVDSAASEYPSTANVGSPYESDDEPQLPDQFSTPPAYPHTNPDGSWSRESVKKKERLPPVDPNGRFERLPVIGREATEAMTIETWSNFEPVPLPPVHLALPHWIQPQNPGWNVNPYWYANTLVQEQLSPANPQTRPIAPADSASPPSPTNGQPNDPQGPIGEAPEEEDVTTQFLRQSTLVLAPGLLQIDAGLIYAWQQAELITVLPPGVPVFELVRNRNFIVPLSFRYGLTPKVETFLSVPLGMGIVERADPLYHDVTVRGPLEHSVTGFTRAVTLCT
jgi:hypothetical protein